MGQTVLRELHSIFESEARGSNEEGMESTTDSFWSWFLGGGEEERRLSLVDDLHILLKRTFHQL